MLARGWSEGLNSMFKSSMFSRSLMCCRLQPVSSRLRSASGRQDSSREWAFLRSLGLDDTQHEAVFPMAGDAELPDRFEMAEVEETLKRLQSQKGVQGIIVVNTEGIPIKSTMDNPTTTQYANLMHNFILKARSTVREIDPQNDLTFLRIRSKKNEIMVAPDKDYFLIVIQNPTE